MNVNLRTSACEEQLINKILQKHPTRLSGIRAFKIDERAYVFLVVCIRTVFTGHCIPCIPIPTNCVHRCGLPGVARNGSYNRCFRIFMRMDGIGGNGSFDNPTRSFVRRRPRLVCILMICDVLSLVSLIRKRVFFLFV